MAEKYSMRGWTGDRLVHQNLAGMTEPVLEPGYPEPESFAVRRCLQAILNRLYAERDLDVLQARSG